MWNIGNSNALLDGVYVPIHFGESLVKWNTCISFDPEIPLLGLYPIEILRHKHKEICLRTFTAALFRIANKLEVIQMSTSRQMDKIYWYIHTME